MRRFFIGLFTGVSITYVGNFISNTYNSGEYSTGFYIANAFYSALPNLLFVAWGLIAIVILAWFTLWRLGKYNNEFIATEEKARLIIRTAEIDKSDIIAKAHTQAREITKEARINAKNLLLKADGKYSSAERTEIKLEQERMNLETEYEKRFEKLESLEQGYVDKIASLELRIERLKEALRKTKLAGANKLRKLGNIAAAERVERKLEKELDAYY